MKQKRFSPVVLLMAMALCAGPLIGKVDASQRSYRYRPPYRTYHYRPSYRPYYRPYYRSYYRPYYRPYFSFGFGAWPYFGAYWGPYTYYQPYYSAPAYYAGGQVGYSYQTGSVRTQVHPKATEVYVDGYYAGVVDDFDGTFQRLYVPPGQHQIELRLEGHRSYRQTLLVNSGTTYKIHHEMVPLGPGETNPPPSQPRQPEPSVESYKEPSRPELPPQERPYPRDEPAPAPVPQEERPPRESRGPSTSNVVAFGMLSLRVKPVDAEIIIDGERWGNLDGLEQMIIHLPAGLHHIEIQKEGYRGFATEVEIRSGETTPLNVSLAL